MADNVDFTPGSGASVATDDVGGIHYQRTKLALGLDGAHDADLTGTAAKGAYVDPRGSSTLIQVSSTGLTTATTAYATGDALGAEMVFAGAVRTTAGTGRIESGLLMDKAKIVNGVDLYLFDRTVTPAADNAAFAFSDADMMFCQGVVEFRGAKTGANNAVLMAVGLPILIKPNATSLYGYMVTQYLHTFFGAVGDLVVTLGIVQD